MSFYKKFGKRIFDLFFAILTIILTSPLILIIVLIQIIIYRGNILFFQTRNTIGQKEFEIKDEIILMQFKLVENNKYKTLNTFSFLNLPLKKS